LFISGSADPVVCDPELDDFVAKPFRPFELLGCVWKVLRGNLPNPRINVASLA
jgi:DNA-binding response OmpR family regulator